MMTLYEFDSVNRWLKDIRLSTETECMSVLQGKSLSVDLQQSSTTLIRSGIDAIRTKSHSISGEFSKLFKCVESERWKHVQPLTVQVTCHIRALIQECNKCIHNTPLFIMEQQEVVMGECAKLAQQVESYASTKPQVPAKIPLVNQLTFLGQSFSRLVDLVLGYLVQKIVESLDESHTPLALTSSISTVISLGLEGEHMCYILSREGGIRALFEICRTDSLEFAHVQALRALATICCVAEAILELEKEGGVDSLTDILCDNTISEAVRGEAAGVIAQITSPCLDNFQHIAGFLENVEDLLSALVRSTLVTKPISHTSPITTTNLCYSTSAHEIFLLAGAAIANITFMDSQACAMLRQFEAPRLLIQASDTQKAQSLFVKDQIATVLANMAAVDTSRDDIIMSNGVQLLLNYLQLRPTNCKHDAEVAACERVQQKAAIALTRLCKESETAKMIVDMQGIPRLVQLCRNIAERNNSDAVLVASLAALRKICAFSACPDMTSIDYHQLVKPRLMDSFLMCSHSDENFV